MPMFEKLKQKLVAKQRLMSTKRAQVVSALQTGPALIILLVVMGIVGAIGLNIVTNVGTGFTGNSLAALNNISLSITNFFRLTPVLGTVLIATVLLAAVIGLLAFVGRNR